MDPITNKVAASGLITLDLENYLPEGEMLSFDLKEYLFMGLILKEREYREALKKLDWQQYAGKNVAVICSADAIIPVWAYMVLTSYLQPIAKNVFVGTIEEMRKHLFLNNLSNINEAEFANERIVVKGCGDEAVEPYAYAEITRKLRPIAKSIMYGEACSTVPVYKQPRQI